MSLALDCIRTSLRDGNLEVTRPIFAGKTYATLFFKSSPQMAMLRPNVFPLVEPESRTEEVIRKEVVIAEELIKAQAVEIIKEKGAELDVTKADIFVSEGRGMNGPENFNLLNEPSSLFPHSAVGASRSAVDTDDYSSRMDQHSIFGRTLFIGLYVPFF